MVQLSLALSGFGTRPCKVRRGRSTPATNVRETRTYIFVYRTTGEDQNAKVHRTRHSTGFHQQNSTIPRSMYNSCKQLHLTNYYSVTRRDNRRRVRSAAQKRHRLDEKPMGIWDLGESARALRNMRNLRRSSASGRGRERDLALFRDARLCSRMIRGGRD